MPSYSRVDCLKHPLFSHHNLQIMIKRDDLIHPIISGNKWRKLKYNIIHAKQHNKGVISFGGAYSNHIHALAFACHQAKIKAIGIIRGESKYADNFTLKWARHWGMALNFVDRRTYKQRDNIEYLQQLQRQYNDYYIIPEGGSNSLAVTGVGEIMTELAQECQFDSLLTPVGSGGTFAGLITGDNNQHKLLGIAVLKQPSTMSIRTSIRTSIKAPKTHSQQGLTAQVYNLLPDHAKKFTNWQVLPQYHRGGYAKFSQQDSQKLIEFSQITGVKVEPVYSGKMILALLDLIADGYFPANHKIVLLHTGGLQGLGGLAERGLISPEHWPVPSIAPIKD